MNNLIKYGVIAAIIGGIYLFNNNSSDDLSSVEDEIDLNVVLDITLDTLYSYQEQLDATATDSTTEDGVAEVDAAKADMAFIGFADALAVDYNAAQPALYKTPIAVMPRDDASLLAYDDANKNLEFDEGEDGLFLIEIDGERARIIASSRSGAVNEHHFSGTGLLAGYLLGSMMNRQRMAGVTSQQLAGKKPVTAKAAARARAGSGSHSSGK